jgi:hypothetical protein
VRLWRFLYDADGGVQVMRLVVTLIVAIGLAFFGTLLLFATPAVADSSGGQAAWVLFATVALKLPLLALLWQFVLRNREWPGRRTEWSRSESQEILSYIEAEAMRALDRPDAGARLAYLSGEAWHVADAVEGDVKVDALTVALRIDELRARAARRTA